MFKLSELGGFTNSPPQIHENITLEASNDWFSFTFDSISYYNELGFPKKSSKDKLTSLIKACGFHSNFDDFSIEKCFKNNFRARIFLDEGIEILLYGPLMLNGNHATMFNATGKGCTRLTTIYNSWKSLIEWTFENNCNYTRLDSALDDKLGEHFRFKDFVQKVKAKEYTTYANTIKFYGEYNPSSEDGYNSCTAYVGNPKTSDCFMRVYKKNWETNQEEEIPYWVRYEVVLKDHERIKQMLVLYLEAINTNSYVDFIKRVISLVRYVIEFRDKNPNCDRKDTWPINKKWDDLMLHFPSAELRTSKRCSSDFYTSLNWFITSAGKSLGEIYMAFGEVEFIYLIMHMVASSLTEMDTSSLIRLKDVFFKEKKIDIDTPGVKQDLLMEIKRLAEEIKINYQDNNPDVNDKIQFILNNSKAFVNKDNHNES